MKIQFTSAISYIVLGVFLFTGGLGCKGASSALVQKTRPITLEYWTVFDDVDALTQLAEAYKTSHPYVTFKIRQFRADEIYQQFVDALAEDKGPDIISVQDRSIGRYQSKLSVMPASVEDVTVQVIKGQFGNTVNYGNQMTPLPSATQLSREYVQAVGDTVVRGGKAYGLPLSFDTMALYYNKDLLDRAGIAQPPKTWDEFVADAKKLTKFDKDNSKIIQSGAALGTGLNVPGSDDLLYVLFRQSNVPFINTQGRAIFDQGQVGGSGPVVDFLSDFANPTRDRYSWNANQENALDSFARGRLAFFFGYNYHYPLITQRAPQMNFDVVALPQLKPDSPVNAANFWIQAVPLKSKNQNSAWAFVNYITHTAGNKTYLDRTSRPAALRSLLTPQISAGTNAQNTASTALSVFASQALTADVWYKGNNYEGAKSAINDMLRDWLLTPADSAQVGPWKQDVLNRAASRINQTFL